jgi:DMSO/TMAO reductase YedYZ molybdopterin-dependent catalytic subunit
MISRRSTLQAAGTLLTNALVDALPGAPRALADGGVDLPFANGKRPLVSYPGKRPLISLTSRPPQLETPFAVFDEGVITPNDAFFVRYHLADIPLSIDPETYRIAIGGKVDRPFSISLAELRTAFEPIEIVAVNQCSGNSRGFFEPRVGGGQLGNGAMGNARWRGAPLKALLDKGGVQAGARQVVFNGLDQPVFPETPDFLKALDIDHARDGEVMIAYEMNGEELPWLNGYPARLVVPGHYGTYWVKHLSEITVIDGVHDGFWMKTAYRIPDNACACTEPPRAATATIPINRLNVRSFITNLADGAEVKAHDEILVKGIAFDGGHGLQKVLFSSNDGESWIEAKLGADLGRYSFREWRIATRLAKGEHRLRVCAINRIGQSQPMAPLWNPMGYMRNSVEELRVIAQ